MRFLQSLTQLENHCNTKKPGNTKVKFQNKKENSKCIYYFENKLRKVYPYNFPVKFHAKPRWFGKKIVDAFTEEFSSFKFQMNEFEHKINAGDFTANKQKIDKDFIIKKGDTFESVIHVHENPVLETNIEIVHIDDNFVVVDKPASIPTHPVNFYKYNSITAILEQKYSLKSLFCPYRIDRLASGTLVLCRNSKTLNKIIDDIKTQRVTKYYLSLVIGEFPDGIIDCNKPIQVVDFKIGFSSVSTTGKPSLTKFKKLHYNGKYSLVLCMPVTGRKHQIRVHLQYLGYPIVNDILYNENHFDNNFYNYYKFLDPSITIKQTKYNRIFSNRKFEDYDNFSKNQKILDFDLAYLNSLKELNYQNEYKNITNDYSEFNQNFMHIDQHCFKCQNKFEEPSLDLLELWLHAIRYQGPDWDFQTRPPIWVNEFLN